MQKMADLVSQRMAERGFVVLSHKFVCLVLSRLGSSMIALAHGETETPAVLVCHDVAVVAPPCVDRAQVELCH